MEIPELSFAAATDVGQKRDHNEDNFLVDKKLGFFVVCDGMGGHAAGEVASAMAVRTLHEAVKEEQELLADYCAGKQGAAKVTRREILNILEFATNRASSKINALASTDTSKRGMGTTLVAALFLGNQAFIVHVGDSRLYQLRGGQLKQLTMDHNVHNELLKRKKFTMEQIREMAPKNAITRAVGVYESCEPETLMLDVVAGDRYLLCSDGLSGYFEEPHGTEAELGVLLGREDIDALASDLVKTANGRGGKDNITAVVVAIGAVEGEHAAAAHRVELKKKVLSEMRLFKALDERELLRVLEGTEEARFDPGSRIISQGDDGDALFIVLTGEVDVLSGDAVVRTLKSGEHFGEMALIRSQPRSASVISRGASELLLIRRSEFFEIMRSQPRIAVKLLWEFTGVLADRLAETTKSLGSARVELAEELSPDEFQEEISQTGVIAIEDDDDRQTIRIPPPPASLPPEDDSEEPALAERQDET